MKIKNILYYVAIIVLLYFITYPSLLLISSGGQVLKVIGYIGIAATIGEILLLMCPPDRAGKKPDPGSPNSSHELP